MRLAQYGLGFGNLTATPLAAGEERLIRRLAAIVEPHVFDVGAFTGGYATRLRGLCPGAQIWAFEPNPSAFKLLREAADSKGFTAINLGLSDTPGVAQLYDHGTSIGTLGSEHATLWSGVIEGIHHAKATADLQVEVTTVDAFMESERVTRLHMLKLDVEGHELAILRGAKQAIMAGKIDAVQFEFNEMNVISRVFFRDFYEVLPSFVFYRMVTDGLVPLGRYEPRTHELFFLQNVVAIRAESDLRPHLLDA
jgi:FkbM family methyltransferase